MSEAIDLLSQYRTMFPQACEVAYLDTAAEGLPFAGGNAALDAYFADKSIGSPGRRQFHYEEERTRLAVAKLLGSDVENVALISSASEALNLIANSIEWGSGDEVIISDLEFPSGVLAWLRLERKGVKVRVIASEGGRVSIESFKQAITAKTRVVCVSSVSYKTGTRIPFLRELSTDAHSVGALLVVDATQSLGRIPVCTDGIDFLVASGYKWLLGVHGLSIAYVSPSTQGIVVPSSVGWYSITDLFRSNRFEQYTLKPGAAWMMCGMPAFPSIYALRRSLEFLLDVGIERIEAELQPLVTSLHDGLEELGFEVLTPHDPLYSSGIVSFSHFECERVAELLGQQKVVVWAGDGRVRASIHLYNDQSDVDQLLHQLASLAGIQAAGPGLPQHSNRCGKRMVSP